jgi:hypothetical protein
MEEYYFSFSIGSTKPYKVRSQNSPLVLKNHVWSRKVAYKLICFWRKKMMYQIFILNLPTSKCILFTMKIIIFHIYFKGKYAKTNTKTVIMHCYTTFVTKNKFSLKHFRSFFIILFLSFFLSFFIRFIFTFIFTVTSGNTTSLIGPWSRTGSSEVRFTIHGIFLYWKIFFVPKNPNIYTILSGRMKRTQKLFRKFGGMVDVKFRKQLFYENTHIEGS